MLHLFLQLQKGVEDSEVELLHEGVDVEFDFVLKELVLQSLLAGVGAGPLEALFVLAIVLRHLSDLFVVISSGQRLETVWSQLTTGRVELLSVVLGELGACNVRSGSRHCHNTQSLSYQSC